VVGNGPHLTGPQIAVGVAIASLVHLLLAAFYVRRFGRIAEREIVSPRAAMRTTSSMEWLAPPRRSPLAAIAWKQYRESGPISLAGLVGIIGVVATVVGAQLFVMHEWRVVEMIGELYTHVAVVFGFFIALVVGIGVCLADTSPRLNTFWRSRPIHPDLWFWCKYATGLAVVLVATYAPIVLLGGFEGERYGGANGTPVSVLLLGLAAVFAAAVAMTSLLRHAVYAAILSLATVYLSTLIGLGCWLIAAIFGWVEANRDLWWEPTNVSLAAGLATSVGISTLVAWLAVRYDWGWKCRY
jgi:hypothetical protein